MATPMPPNGPWISTLSPGYSLHPISLRMFEALEAGDLVCASSDAPVYLPPLPPFLISAANRGIWLRRLNQVAADPEHIPWLSRLIVYEAKMDLEERNSDLETRDSTPAVIVGRIGFHGKPDERGIVEVGYETDPSRRRRGHARAAMRIMIDVARLIQGVNVIRASVAGENWISRRIVEGEGLRKVGKERHEKRGWEDIFEMDVSE